MKRNFNVIVRDFDGTAHVKRVDQYDEYGVVIADKDGQPLFAKFVPMTLRDYAIQTLAQRYRGEEAIAGEELVKRMRLADKLVYAGDEAVDITSEEGKIILDTFIKANMSALVFTRMKDMIDTDPKPETAPATAAAAPALVAAPAADPVSEAAPAAAPAPAAHEAAEPQSVAAA